MKRLFRYLTSLLGFNEDPNKKLLNNIKEYDKKTKDDFLVKQYNRNRSFEEQITHKSQIKED